MKLDQNRFNLDRCSGVIVTKQKKKKIIDEVPEEYLFDMSYMFFFKDIEKKKNWGIFILCSVFGNRTAELSKAVGLRNVCYSKSDVFRL